MKIEMPKTKARRSPAPDKGQGDLFEQVVIEKAMQEAMEPAEGSIHVYPADWMTPGKIWIPHA